MSFIKTSILNALATFTRVISGIILNKILAIYVGPTGYAVIGQLQNIMGMLTALAGGLFANGIIKETAENHTTPEIQHRIWSTAIKLSTSISLLIAILVFFSRDLIAKEGLGQQDYSNILIWLALSIPAFATNNLLLAIINGKKEIGIYVGSNIIGSLISLANAATLSFLLGLYGALIALIINPGIVLISTIFMLRKKQWWLDFRIKKNIDPNSMRKLSYFALMGLTSAIAIPTSHMIIRNVLTESLGTEAAGYWQAMWKISEIYLTIITSTLAIYYLPRIAEIKEASILKKEVLKIYSFVMPIVIASAFTIYILRNWIISTLFTEDFKGMEILFFWQLAGDIVKIGAWVLAFIMHGKAMTKAFIITEILASTLFVFLTYILVKTEGLEGVSKAHLFNYIVYFVVVAVILKSSLSFPVQPTREPT